MVWFWLFLLIMMVFLSSIWFFDPGPVWPITTRKEMKYNKEFRARERHSVKSSQRIQIPPMPDSSIIDKEWWEQNVVGVIDSHKKVLALSNNESDLLNQPHGQPEAVNVAIKLKGAISSDIFTISVYMPYADIGIQSALENHVRKQYPDLFECVESMSYDYPVTHSAYSF